jgi:hypothetical protein
VSVLLLLPHMVIATAEFGAPWGRVTYTGGIVRGAVARPLDELARYAAWFPSQMAGPAAAALIVLGIAGTAVVVATRAAGPLRRGLVLLTVPGVVVGVAMAASAPADERFLLPSIAYLVIAGAIACGAALGHRAEARGPVQTSAVLLTGAIALTLWLPHASEGHRWAHGYQDRVAAGRTPVRAAAQELAARTTGDCFVVTPYGPQITWYGGCAAARYSQVQPAELRQGEVGSGQRWLLLFDGGKAQPEGQHLQEYLAVTRSEPEVVIAGQGTLGEGRLYRVQIGEPARADDESAVARP